MSDQDNPWPFGAHLCRSSRATGCFSPPEDRALMENGVAALDVVNLVKHLRVGGPVADGRSVVHP